MRAPRILPRSVAPEGVDRVLVARVEPGLGHEPVTHPDHVRQVVLQRSGRTHTTDALVSVTRALPNTPLKSQGAAAQRSRLRAALARRPRRQARPRCSSEVTRAEISRGRAALVRSSTLTARAQNRGDRRFCPPSPPRGPSTRRGKLSTDPRRDGAGRSLARQARPLNNQVGRKRKLFPICRAVLMILMIGPGRILKQRRN